MRPGLCRSAIIAREADHVRRALRRGRTSGPIVIDLMEWIARRARRASRDLSRIIGPSDGPRRAGRVSPMPGLGPPSFLGN